MSLADQFKHGRIPIRPLALKDKDLASTKELLIDNLGDNPTYHIFITDDKDRTKLIDITNLIIKEILFPTVNADNMQVTIEGEENPDTLRNIINFIYKRFLMPEDPNGFNYEEDYDKITDPLTKSILLKDKDGIIYLPVTSASNVYDSTGASIEERLNNMTKLGFYNTFVRSTSDNGQNHFTFTLPFPNYDAGGNMIELFIGTTRIDPSRYYIEYVKDSDSASITLIDEVLEYGRAINILCIYNSKDVSGSVNNYLFGGLIANGSIPIGKLQKYSDRYDLNDPTSVATSKALYNLYLKCCELLKITPDENTGSVTGNYKLSTSRFVHTCIDAETTISYDGLYNCEKCEIFVYRNGVRLFDSIDYTVNSTAKTITLYVRTEQNERIVFETHDIVKR